MNMCLGFTLLHWVGDCIVHIVQIDVFAKKRQSACGRLRQLVIFMCYSCYVLNCLSQPTSFLICIFTVNYFYGCTVKKMIYIYLLCYVFCYVSCSCGRFQPTTLLGIFVSKKTGQKLLSIARKQHYFFQSVLNVQNNASFLQKSPNFQI